VRTNRTGGPDTRSTRSYQVNIGASWEPDVFGRLRLAVESATSAEQISEADLAAARLAPRANWAANYLGLRETDVLYKLAAETLAGYARSMQITRNRYEAGVVARTDVPAGREPVRQQPGRPAHHRAAAREHWSTRSRSWWARRRRTSACRWTPNWSVKVPRIPPEVPSTLLQRRPDIAAAERQVAQANAQIGIARRGFFPSINLTGALGASAASIGDLFSASTLVVGAGHLGGAGDLRRRRHPAAGGPVPRFAGPRLGALPADGARSPSRTWRTSWSRCACCRQQQSLRPRRAARPTWWSSRCSIATRRGRSITPR
jgi:hypothetical protein